MTPKTSRTMSVFRDDRQLDKMFEQQADKESQKKELFPKNMLKFNFDEGS